MDALAWPLPALPASGSAPVAAAEPLFRARRFGARPEDLDVDCGGGDRSTAVTRVLAACLEDAAGGPLETGRIWEASLSWRLQGLLAVAVATRGVHFEAEGECPREDCGEPLDFAFDLRDFGVGDLPRRIDWHAGGRLVSVRLPTGMDQRRWAAAPPADWADMARTLIESVDGRPWEGDAAGLLHPDSLESLSDRLDAADPLTGLRVDAACPRCGAASPLELDLELLLLRSLAAEQRALLRQVHALASVFHWAEADILAMPPMRRARYLRMIEEA